MTGETGGNELVEDHETIARPPRPYMTMPVNAQSMGNNGKNNDNVALPPLGVAIESKAMLSLSSSFPDDETAMGVACLGLAAE